MTDHCNTTDSPFLAAHRLAYRLDPARRTLIKASALLECMAGRLVLEGLDDQARTCLRISKEADRQCAIIGRVADAMQAANCALFLGDKEHEAEFFKALEEVERFFDHEGESDDESDESADDAGKPSAPADTSEGDSIFAHLAASGWRQVSVPGLTDAEGSDGIAAFVPGEGVAND